MDTETRQFEKLRRLIRAIEGSTTNHFYGSRLREAGIGADSLESIEEFTRKMPFTQKAELVADHQSQPPFGTGLTFPLENYTRFCQTSGTSTGTPMAWLDTGDSWQSMLSCWNEVYRAANLAPGSDRIFFAFSFGPFLGFWTAFEAATSSGYLAIPGGGLSSTARLSVMARYDATALCCTPTYALRLGEVLHSGQCPVRPGNIRVSKIIVAGEPGGSVPATRARISELWEGADVFDHHGMTEVGPVSYEHPQRRGHLVIIESAYFAEILDQDSFEEVAEGEQGELVLTTLDRVACPLLRYRTGDLVKKRTVDGLLTLEGGVLGRCDEMKVVRGVNIYPSAVESIVHEFPEAIEFQVVERMADSMEEIEVEVEFAHREGGPTAGELAATLEKRMRDRFSIRIPVRAVDIGHLPRYEFKARRWIKR